MSESTAPILSVTERLAGPCPDGLSPTDLSDARLVERLAERLRGAWRHTAAWGWMHWSGTVWQATPDAVLRDAVRQELIDLYGQATREAAAAGEQGASLARRAPRLLEGRTIESVARLLCGPLLADAAAFDADPHILVCANGVVDLRTLELLPHDPARLVTRSTGVDYDPDAHHAVWDRALEALPDDETRRWLQRRMGQALYGELPPDLAALFWLGAGRNGKSCVLLGLRRAFGDYACIAPPSILEAGDTGDRARPDIVGLSGRRLVILEELADDPRRPLSLTALKRLMSGQAVAARQLYRGTVEIPPTWSIIVAANVIPPIVETDEGSWRRVLRIPAPWRYMDQPTAPHHRPLDPGVFATVQRDPGIPSAVLAWMVEGLRDHAPIVTPETVRQTTQAWREEADAGLSYIRERLTRDPEGVVLLRDLTYDVGHWLRARSQAPWGEGTVQTRIAEHDYLASRGVELRRRVRTTTVVLNRPSATRFEDPPAVPDRATILEGVRFRRRTE